MLCIKGGTIEDLQLSDPSIILMGESFLEPIGVFPSGLKHSCNKEVMFLSILIKMY